MNLNDYIVLPFGDRQTLLKRDTDGLNVLETLPLMNLEHRVGLGEGFLASFAACRSAMIIQSWWPSGRVGAPEVVELPEGVSGETFLLTEEDDLFVGGKSDRPWLGRMNLRDQVRTWIPMLPPEDLLDAEEKAIDAISLTPCGERMIAYDNLLQPLYAWIIDKLPDGWRKARRIEISPVYTYEHIVSAHATYDHVYLITRGINHGLQMQFLRRLDRNARGEEVLASETEANRWSRDDEGESATFESHQEWTQVLATESGSVFLAAGTHGLGRFDPETTELQYLGQELGDVTHMAFVNDRQELAVAVSQYQRQRYAEFDIHVYPTDGKLDQLYSQKKSLPACNEEND